MNEGFANFQFKQEIDHSISEHMPISCSISELYLFLKISDGNHSMHICVTRSFRTFDCFNFIPRLQIILRNERN